MYKQGSRVLAMITLMFLILGGQIRAFAGTQWAQSGVFGGGFISDARNAPVPFFYSWQGSLGLDIKRDGNYVTVNKIDMNVLIYGANKLGNPCGIFGGVSVDVYEGGTKKVKTLLPTSNGSYLYNSTVDLLFGGVDTPKMRFYRPTFVLRMSVLATTGFGGYTYSWSLDPYSDRLYADDVLRADSQITSDNRKAALVMQGDGNLVLYNSQHKPLWASNTSGNPGAFAIMQLDGNMVVYSNKGKPLWSSGTYKYGNSMIVMQGDGNLVMYNKDNKAIWWTGTRVY